MPGWPPRHPILPTTSMPRHPAHRTLRDKRDEASIYWPGLTADIAATRSSCNICNGNTPSQPHMPPITPEEADHPFEHLHADFFHHEGLVLVDRFSGWPIVLQASSGATGLIQVLRETFATFGIPATLTTDGGPEFTAHATRVLLTSWGVHHRISSAYHPHANNRTETGVKTVKRLIAGNTDSGGTLKSAFFKALLIAPAQTHGCHRPCASLADQSEICYLPSQHDFNSRPRTVRPSTRGRQHYRSANTWARNAGQSTPRASPPSNAETEYWCKTRQGTTQPNGTAQAWWSRSCSTTSIRWGWTATAEQPLATANISGGTPRRPPPAHTQPSQAPPPPDTIYHHWPLRSWPRFHHHHPNLPDPTQKYKDQKAPPILLTLLSPPDEGLGGR